MIRKAEIIETRNEDPIAEGFVDQLTSILPANSAFIVWTTVPLYNTANQQINDHS